MSLETRNQLRDHIDNHLVHSSQFCVMGKALGNTYVYDVKLLTVFSHNGTHQTFYLSHFNLFGTNKQKLVTIPKYRDVLTE